VDHGTVQAWLDRYIEAWRTYDPTQIGELFAADARYWHGPFREPIEGRDAVVADWLDSGSRDEPGSWRAEYHPVVVEGATAVVNGRTWYFNPDGSDDTHYDNIFVIRFDDDGRATEFREWWIERPPPTAA